MSQGFCTAHTLDHNSVKLSELRAKTDQQLQKFVESRLNVGLSFAALAEVEASFGDQPYSEGSVERADDALTEVQKLLPAFNREQRRIVEPKLNNLRRAMDRLSRIHESSGTQINSLS
jgi:hypothetical protein